MQIIFSFHKNVNKGISGIHQMTTESKLQKNFSESTHSGLNQPIHDNARSPYQIMS